MFHKAFKLGFHHYRGSYLGRGRPGSRRGRLLPGGGRGADPAHAVHLGVVGAAVAEGGHAPVPPRQRRGQRGLARHALLVLLRLRRLVLRLLVGLLLRLRLWLLRLVLLPGVVRGGQEDAALCVNLK